MRVILASKSPDRKSLFKTLYNNFEVIDSKFDESTISNKNPRKLVESLATGKCESVFNGAKDSEKLVIGADTVVCVGNEVFGKPKNEEDARHMLESYSGTTNKVVTGICIKYARSDGMETKIVFSVVTKIKFREIYENEIDEFVAVKDYLNIAGACTIEGKGGKFMEKVMGSYHNILGLPTSQIYQVLRQENLI